MTEKPENMLTSCLRQELWMTSQFVKLPAIDTKYPSVITSLEGGLVYFVRFMLSEVVSIAIWLCTSRLVAAQDTVAGHMGEEAALLKEAKRGPDRSVPLFPQPSSAPTVI